MLAATSTAVLLALIALRVPIAVAMFLAAAGGLYMIGGGAFVATVSRTAAISVVQKYELLAVPMFLLMAEFIIASGVANELFRAISIWVGRIRGGLAISTALAGAAFGAISGSSTAAAATLSATSIPSMVRQGYDKRMAYGVVAISGTLAMLIPPSIAMIVFAIIADVPIGKMLIAGVIPGIIVTTVIILTVRVLGIIYPDSVPIATAYTWREKLYAFRVAGPVVFLFMSVLGTLYFGIATPTEASAIGAVGAFILLIVNRGLDFPAIWQASMRATATTCMILFIIVGAHVFSYFMALSQTSNVILSSIVESGIGRWEILIIILVIYLIMGCVLDQMAIMVLTIPVVLPVLVSLEFNPIWFGVLFIITAEVGMLTPPMGMNVFVVAKFANEPVDEIFAGVWPHVIAHIFAIALLVAFPQLSLFLPDLMF